MCTAPTGADGGYQETVIASTASPYKFTRSVMKAIDPKYDEMEDFSLIAVLSTLSGTAVPAAIEEIRSAPVRHKGQCEIGEMENAVKAFLKI